MPENQQPDIPRGTVECRCSQLFGPFRICLRLDRRLRWCGLEEVFTIGALPIFVTAPVARPVSLEDAKRKQRMGTFIPFKGTRVRAEKPRGCEPLDISVTSANLEGFADEARCRALAQRVAAEVERLIEPATASPFLRRADDNERGARVRTGGI
jgi:hypothetical protein